MNEETTVNEAASSEELILGKFKNNDEVIKAYKELESKLGELTAQKKEGDQPSEKPSGKPEFSSKVIEDLQNEIKGLKESIVSSKKEAVKPLDDKEFRKQVAAGLSNLPQEKVAEINKRIESGSISETEMQVYANLAAPPAEPSEQISSDKAPVGSEQDAMSEYRQLLATQAAVYCNPRHPNYEEVNERKLQLQKKLGIR